MVPALLLLAALPLLAPPVQERDLEVTARLSPTGGLRLEVDLRGEPYTGTAFLLGSLHPDLEGITEVGEIGPLLPSFSPESLHVVDGEVRLQVPPPILGRRMHLFLLGPGPSMSRILHLGGFGARQGRYDPRRIAVFANAARQQSLTVADEYMRRREIPDENLFVVELNDHTPNQAFLSVTEFDARLQPLLDRLPEHLDLIAITWTWPYRVVDLDDTRRQMSMTSAFLFGTKPDHLVPLPQGHECVTPASLPPSPLFHDDRRAYGAHGLPRPTMMLAGRTTAEALALVERGVAADGSAPMFRGYLVRADPIRSIPREEDMQRAEELWNPEPDVALDPFVIGGTPHPVGQDLMLYQTGDFVVEDVHANGFLPGAAADHLTSFGGALSPVPGQMSVFAWLEAGATGSYGTIREPCNFDLKFPRTTVFLERYLAGETLGEAYVKSVAFPQEGLFVGDPAACPYCPRSEGLDLATRDGLGAPSLR